MNQPIRHRSLGFRSLNGALFSVLIAVCALVACNPEPTDFPVRLDGGEPDVNPEPSPGLDMRVDMQEPEVIIDMDVDMAIDAGPMTDMDAAPPPGPPPRAQTIVLSNRDDGYIGWVSGGRLFSARLLKDAEAVTDITDVADASSLSGRLQGYRLTGSRPYVVLPSGEGGQLQAVDLTGRSAPTDLGLYGPFRVFVDDDVLLVGRLTPDEGAQPAWRVIEVGNRLGAIYEDRAGVPLPHAAATAMGGWVFGFDGPTCLDMTRTASVEAAWFCQGRPGARLVGDGNERLSFVGPTEEGVRMWQAMPSVATQPEGAADPDLRVDLAQGAIIDWFPQPTTGQLVHISEEGGAEALWWIRATQTQRAEVSDPESILGLSVIRSDIRVIRWDADAGEPVPEAVEFAAGPTPPIFDPPRQCNAYAAETCGSDDLDCNGVPQGGLCCREGVENVISTRLAVGDEPDERWFAGVADVGLVLMVRIAEANEVRLFNQPRNDDSGDIATQEGVWENITALKRFSNRSTQIVALADAIDFDNPVEEGMPPNTVEALLWFRGVEREARTTPPCAEVRGLRVLNAAGRTRVWCADMAVDLDAGAAMGDVVAYPEGTGAVQWIEPNALGQANQVLVAHGDDYALALWTLDDDLNPVVSNEALPMEVTLLSAEERMLPFRLPVIAGGRTARVNGAQLETLVPGQTWTKVPGVFWPIAADISRYEPVAISIGYTELPGSRGALELTRFSYFIHSLQPGTQPWGNRYNPAIRVDSPRTDYHGARFGDFPSGAFEDPIFVFAEGNAGANGVSYEATQLPCEP